jgi:hypothetical protein
MSSLFSAEPPTRGTDRAVDGTHVIADVLRRESAALDVDGRVTLGEACVRRECALAYRAMVDAVHSEAELAAGAPVG